MKKLQKTLQTFKKVSSTEFNQMNKNITTMHQNIDKLKASSLSAKM